LYLSIRYASIRPSTTTTLSGVVQFADFPDPTLDCDYLPELSRPASCTGPALPELGADEVCWEDLPDMDLPSFRPAFLVLCRVLLNVIHECLKLRLEQRPAGEPSLLSIKQVRDG